jgi:hypothetical protein
MGRKQPTGHRLASWWAKGRGLRKRRRTSRQFPRIVFRLYCWAQQHAWLDDGIERVHRGKGILCLTGFLLAA